MIAVIFHIISEFLLKFLPDQKAIKTDSRRKSLYAVTGIISSPTQKEQNRKTWYAETKDLSPKSVPKVIKTQNYSKVIEEFSSKNLLLKATTIEEFRTNLENDSALYNQSIRSFGSSKTDESSVVMDPALEFLHDEPLYQFYDAAVLGVSRILYL